MKLETKIVLLMLARRRKQELLGKPVDPWPDYTPEEQLLVIDMVLEELKGART